MNKTVLLVLLLFLEVASPCHSVNGIIDFNGYDGKRESLFFCPYPDVIYGTNLVNQVGGLR